MHLTTAVTSDSGKLFVFLHGNIVLLERQNDLLAIFIDMGADHVYRAGNWLLETTIQRGTRASLENVQAGSAGSSTLETTLKGVEFLHNSSLVHSVFTLKKPKVPITALRLTSTSQANLSITAPAVHHPPAGDALGGVRIIEYDFDDVAKVKLDNFAWRAALFSPENRVSTLHLFAEPDGEVGPNHNREEFRTAALVLQGVNVDMQTVPSMAPLEICGYPQGLPRAEVETLFERRLLLEGVAAFYRNHNDAGLLRLGAFGGPGGRLCGSLAAVSR